MTTMDEIAKGLSTAAHANLTRLAMKPSKKGEWALQRLRRQSQGARGARKNGELAARFERNLRPNLKSNTRQQKGPLVGMRGSLKERKAAGKVRTGPPATIRSSRTHSRNRGTVVTSSQGTRRSSRLGGNLGDSRTQRIF